MKDKSSKKLLVLWTKKLIKETYPIDASPPTKKYWNNKNATTRMLFGRNEFDRVSLDKINGKSERNKFAFRQIKKQPMTRKAILIGSPEQNNTENYLKGVEIDLLHVTHFLKSPIGGSWTDNEMQVLINEPSKKLIDFFQNTQEDFLLVYFSGHGNQNLHETLLAFNESEAISISQILSLITSPKSLFIVDTCRKSVGEHFENMTGPEYIHFENSLHQLNTRELYKQKIAECSDGIAIAYSCSVGETSYEAECGGLFTYSLLKTSLNWYESKNNTGVLEIGTATHVTQHLVKRNSCNEQTPQLIALRNKQQSLNFPIALKITVEENV
jgi:hypothetical protein